MSHVMLLVSAEGATLGETRLDDEGPDARTFAEAQLREEALTSGFTDDEVRSAHLAVAGDPPQQP